MLSILIVRKRNKYSYIIIQKIVQDDIIFVDIIKG